MQLNFSVYQLYFEVDILSLSEDEQRHTIKTANIIWINQQDIAYIAVIKDATLNMS